MLRSLRFWAGVAVSAVFIALFLRATHPHELGDALGQVNYWYLLPAALVLFVAISIRCIRWSILIRPLAPLSPLQLFPYAVIGYMANNLLPARAGEVVRAYVLGEREHISRVGTLGTIAVERLFDGCVLVLMLLIAGTIVGFESGRLQLIAAISTVLFVAAFIGFYVLTLSEARAKRVMHRLARLLPARLEDKAEAIADSLVISLRSVHDWRSLALVAGLSGAAWTVEAGSYAIVGQGFNMDVGFGHYCLLLAAANLAIIVPTFFGGTGPFEWAAKLVLVGGNVLPATASAYAIVSHAFILIPTTILGLLILWSFGLSFGRITHVRVDNEEVVAP
ncbi:hypothetical protein AYO38_06555 [bacterium SCGC AG-212-C10]|nr:hypothetical protein AYO38_06555 [bacterium SCGC AG-212-C10]